MTGSSRQRINALVARSHRPLQKREGTRKGSDIVVFRLFGKLRYSNERSSKFEITDHQWKYFEEQNGKMVAFQISPKIESLHELGRHAINKFIRVCIEFCSFWKAPILTIFN